MIVQLAGDATPNIGGRCTKLVKLDSFDEVVKFRGALTALTTLIHDDRW